MLVFSYDYWIDRTPMRSSFYFWLCVILFSSLVSAEAGNFDTVIAVGATTITIQTAVTKGYKITSIDSDGKTTTNAASNIVIYKVDTFTVILVDGLKSSLGDVKAGMKADAKIGMDPSILASITAMTVVPAPKAKPGAKPATKGKGVKPPPPRIGMDKVLSVTSDRITIASAADKYARAYFITPHTVVKLDGNPSDTNAIRVGMNVHITVSDQTDASEIELHTAGH